MGETFSIMDRLTLAFAVISRWEVLATLGAFIAFWLLIRYVADPWREKAQRMPKAARKAAKKAPTPAPAAEETIDDDDILPD
jgi:hypothetical protein